MLTRGEKLGPYEIVAPLASGGMGDVYRAHDPRLERSVAIKVLPERLAKDPEAAARFAREARTVAALSHPHILAIHDFGLEGGLAYAVTELLEGETLRRRLDRGPLPLALVRENALAIAAALGAAHEKGIVHRDVKPENVFLTRDGGLKILDFGVAKASEAPKPEKGASGADTEPGVLVGTIGYMSPEQVRCEPVDPRSDLFSFGCVLYEMITGARAFRKATPADTLAAILNDEPPPIDRRATGCPAELARLVEHCLRKEREARFQSARDLAFALETAAGDTRAPRRESRRPAIASVAILPFAGPENEPAREYLADGLTEDLINAVASRAKARVIARSSVFRWKSAAADPREIGRELGVSAVVTGRVAAREGDLDVFAELVDAEDGAQLWGGRFRRPAADLLALEEEIADAIVRRIGARARGRSRPKAARRPSASEAYDLYLRGRFEWNRRTEDGFEKALALFDEAIRRDPGLALAYAGIADAYVFLGGYGHLAPEIAYPRSRAAAEKALSIASSAEAHNSLASVLHRFAWDFAGAEREFRLALADNPAHATAHHWYGLFLLTMGRFDEAWEEIERASALDPLSLVVREDRGYFHHCRRDYADAERVFRGIAESDPAFLPARFDLGIALVERGDLADGISEIRGAVSAAGERPRAVATLAWALAAAGEKDEARALLRGLAAPAFSVALVHTALGETDAAFAELGRAIDRREDAAVSLLVNPRVDALRGDSRFDALLRRVGFPKRARTADSTPERE
ncbi:MAG TPA: protein kinase [Thermoanaerobaculia bacterium]|nr:protein kinase [Thermoanaerobaculia bacterium]